MRQERSKISWQQQSALRKNLIQQPAAAFRQAEVDTAWLDVVTLQKLTQGQGFEYSKPQRNRFCKRGNPSLLQTPTAGARLLEFLSCQRLLVRKHRVAEHRRLNPQPCNGPMDL